MSDAAAADAAIEQATTWLSEAGISVDVKKHDKVMTVEEWAPHTTEMKGNLTKNLFFKAKNKKLFLVVAHHDTKVNTKPLGKFVKSGGGIRFGSAELMEETIGCVQGAVTPLGVKNDTENKTIVLFDSKLANAKDEPVLIHPMTNYATIGVLPDDLISFMEGAGNTVQVVDFDDLKAPAAAPPKKQKKTVPNKKKKKNKPKKGEAIGITHKKMTQFPQWYSEVVVKSEMIEYYPISGCYIMRPWSFTMWELIQEFLDSNFKALGVKNSYFPLFVTKKALCAEEDHIEGFAPEVAWVTKSGTSDLEEHIAIRPTSETIIYPAYKKWIRSHRDLPMQLNQWCSVVRWEFKCPTPFIRCREFLWQEGHSAFATLAEAEVEVLQILSLYARVYEELMAVPVVKGKKTEEEKFAGGFYTTTVEAFIPATGRGIQGATSHCLGQNFADMFDITFSDEKKESKKVWQNSWGLTVRTIGVLIMVHGDDKGLVLPPKMAPLQVVCVPILFKDSEATIAKAQELIDELKGLGIRADLDDRKDKNPGWKFNDWEMRGVPVRLELGPKDIAAEQVVAAIRYNGEKETIAWADLSTRIPALLDEIQAGMLARARTEQKNSMRQCSEWSDFIATLNDRKMALAPWCGVKQCELNIKAKSQEEADDGDEAEAAAAVESGATGSVWQGEKLTGAAKSLCIPFNQPELPADMTCVHCQQKAINWTLFGRSY